MLDEKICVKPPNKILFKGFIFLFRIQIHTIKLIIDVTHFRSFYKVIDLLLVLDDGNSEEIQKFQSQFDVSEVLRTKNGV